MNSEKALRRPGLDTVAPDNSKRTQAENSLLPILSVNFVGTLGFSIVVPILVFLVTKWGGNAFIYGLIGATYSTFQLIGAPILGRWSDRIGRRKILLLSQFGTLVSWLIFLAAFFLPVQVLLEIDSGVLGEFAVTVPLIILFLARAIDGITGGNVSVANAYLADITTDEDRSSSFGKMALSGNLGFMLGPALAGLLGASTYGEALPVFTAMLISLAALLLIVLLLPEQPARDVPHAARPRGLKKAFGHEQKDCLRASDPIEVSIFEILKIRSVARLLGIYFLVMLGFSFFYTGFPIHAATALEWSLAETGVFFAFLSMLMAIVQGPILAKATCYFSDRALTRFGTIVLCLGFVCLYLQNSVTIYLAALLVAVGNGLMWPSVMALLSIAAGDEHQGAAQGTSGSVSAMASILGLIAGGLLYESMGVLVFILAAVIMLPIMPLTPNAVEKPG